LLPFNTRFLLTFNNLTDIIFPIAS
jgi:hypothetical protein